MHRPAFRSAIGRTARGVLPTRVATAPLRPTPAPTAAYFFSSTPSQAVLKRVPGRRDRLAAAASEVSSLGQDDTDAPAPRASPAPNPAAGPVTDARSLGAAPPSNPHFTSGPVAGGDNTGPGSKIINVRSLPRGLSGRPRFPGPSGVSSSLVGSGGRSGPNSNPAFRRSPLPGSSGAGGAGGRGGRGPGPRRRKRQVRQKERGEDEGKKQEDDLALTDEERAWLDAEEMGKEVVFEPALTLEGLLPHRPAVASTAVPVANVASVLRDMRVYAGGWAFGGSQEPAANIMTSVLNPERARAALEAGQVVFFDTAEERAMVDRALHSRRQVKRLAAKKLPADTSLIAPVSSVVKTAVLETAVRGLYAGPHAAAAGTSMLDKFHRYQAKEHTFTEEHGRQFDAKILELLPQAGAAAPAARPAAKGKKARA